MIEAKIYDQEGLLQTFRMKETVSNRLFAEWLRVHDRANSPKEAPHASE
ncbi:MAG: hypothetical protein ABW128_15555 [Rhizorhabdus sp.]